MTGNAPDDRTPESDALRCPTCGTRYTAGDRFCSQCGAALPAPPTRETPLAAWDAADTAGTPAPPAPAGAGIAATDTPERPQESTLWLLSAQPRAVFGGGFLLLLLAVVLLLVGQLDWTGTLVMLSICVAALGLFTIVVGVLRALWSAVGRGA